MAALRIAPAPTHTASTTPTLGAPSAPGVHDTLRSNLGLAAPASALAPIPQQQLTQADGVAPEPLQSAHPLEARLARWRATQDALKMEGLRRAYGVAEPVRRGMELRDAARGEWRPKALGGSAGVHGDVLAGRDAEVAWEDVFKGDELREQPDFHTEMEARLRMNW
ncbi:uncharacterized protein K452DRAFT_283934 [Aplosporella prunicola CBS 121167]|uniref:Proteasome maturation factor UMP1 n=1 Tax=Aplosporella prunicola CBS 121167 TaxID=1176127 RepID=A0A6A6BNA2_9PEZI|nr:uncharacterized protein K452DRAFT_283934 [Aplosporella prunicola CBS 121167]KAF2145582.1 hypothetical protein K452DRAFT_283934 [Aplosporella prunicola CBS 121167]